MTLRKALRYGAVLVCVVLSLAGRPAAADDKEKAAPAGVWVRKEGELRIEFSDKDVLKISPHGKDEVICVLCKYTAGKEGLIKAKITELEGKEKEKAKGVIPIGLEFSFTWQVKDDVATLGDLKGENVEVLKSHLEGKYDQKK